MIHVNIYVTSAAVSNTHVDKYDSNVLMHAVFDYEEDDGPHNVLLFKWNIIDQMVLQTLGDKEYLHAKESVLSRLDDFIMEPLNKPKDSMIVHLGKLHLHYAPHMKISIKKEYRHI